jgi:hypothetical protein
VNPEADPKAVQKLAPLESELTPRFMAGATISETGHGRPPSPNRRRGSAGGEFSAVVARHIHPDPGERPSTTEAASVLIECQEHADPEGIEIC